jgi:hypothetical protein
MGTVTAIRYRRQELRAEHSRSGVRSARRSHAIEPSIRMEQSTRQPLVLCPDWGSMVNPAVSLTELRGKITMRFCWCVTRVA